MSLTYTIDMADLEGDFSRAVLEAVQAAATDNWVPQIQAETRVDTGGLQASTRVELDTEEPALYVVQGGTELCFYGNWVELRFGDFSSSCSGLNFEFGG
jgi:hypothetical protein